MYSVLDIETTGGAYNEESITEIAIHRFDGFQVVDSFISLINPERDIQPFVQKLTGITNESVRTAPKFYQVAKRIVEITEGSILVAHNAPFDYRILRTEFRRLGFDFQRPTLCTVDLSKKLIPEAESHSLGKLVRALGIPISNRHRANGDALATLKLFQILLDRDSEKQIVGSLLRSAAYGELSDRQLELVASVPSETGVYYLYGKEGKMLYLNAASDMKKEVNRHFTGMGVQAKSLRKSTREVRFERTGSMLLAKLKADMELRKNKPLFRPKTARWSESVSSEISVNGETYPLSSNLLLMDRGRSSGEHGAIWISGGKLKAMGFVSLNHQIYNHHILETLLTPIQHYDSTLHLVVGYLLEKRIQRVLEMPATP
jgi:DNA polymerase-3 subunit epsilon